MTNKQINTEDARIVIANDLRSGLTVFLTDTGTWSLSVTDAMILNDEEGASIAMQTAAADEAANKVTGAYLTDSNRCGKPIDLREVLRVNGPSINYLPPGQRDTVLAATYQSRSGSKRNVSVR